MAPPEDEDVQAQTPDALRGGQEAQEDGFEARCVVETSQPSHSLPLGRFEALPRIVQIAGVGERLVALTINGELWESWEGCGWTRVGALPKEAR